MRAAAPYFNNAQLLKQARNRKWGGRGSYLVDAKQYPDDFVIEVAQRYTVAETLRDIGAEQEVVRRWKMGPYRGSARTQGVSDALVDALSDGRWHSARELVAKVPIRPEVAIRIYINHVENRAAPSSKHRTKADNAASDMTTQIMEGSRYYIQHMISDLKTRKPQHHVERRGKRGQAEYRLLR